MVELVIWAHSICRSTYPLYRELAKRVEVRLLAREGLLDYRREQGDTEADFRGLPYEVLGENLPRAKEILEETRGAVHLVAAYQVSPMMREVVHVAKCRGDKVIVISEAPWNAQRGVKKWIWELYLRTILKVRLRRVIKEADALVNYSGDQEKTALAVGWPKEKIVSFGYFPEWMRGVEKVGGGGAGRLKAFVPGTKGRRGRGEEVVREALAPLSERIDLVMPDFVGVRAIEKMYAEADLLIAAGENEPWGVRVNDAINCGLPVVVSDGMGAEKIVRETGAGLVFGNGDAESLRLALKEMIDNYADFASRAFAARELISPKAKARELLSQVGLLKYEEVR